MTRFLEMLQSDGWEESSIRQFTQLLCYGEKQANWDLLIDQVDESDYGATDWAAALLAFDNWLSDQQIETRPIPEMIGYLHCCTLTSAQTLSPPPLDRLLVKMLHDFGFEAA